MNIEKINGNTTVKTVEPMIVYSVLERRVVNTVIDIVRQFMYLLAHH